MALSSTITVREVALEVPHATRLFEQIGIDYCCGGNRQLADACSDAGIDLQRLNELLARATVENGHENVDFKTLTLTDLIDHILDKHHSYTKEEMTRLTALTAKVVNAHGANHPELTELQAKFELLCSDLAPHMFKEEQILFPYILEMERAATFCRSLPSSCFGTVSNPIHMMMMEHDTASEILRNIRRLSSHYKVPDDACLSYKTLYESLEAFEQDLHQHIHLENNLLFPKAIEMEAKF